MGSKPDPFQSREARRYSEPIVSREAIIGYLTDLSKPASEAMIRHHFSISGSKIVALQRRLAAMVRDGQILSNRQKKYVLVDHLDLVKAQVTRISDGVARLISEHDEVLVMSRRQSRCLMVDDTVLLRVGSAKMGSRRKGTLVDVLSRGHKQVVGRYVKDDDMQYVTLSQSVMQSDIILLSRVNIPVQPGDYVVVKIERYPQERQLPSGVIVECVGSPEKQGFEIELAIRAYDLPYQWPSAVRESVLSLPSMVRKQDRQGRVDLRHLPFVTIDGETAKDFDDAIYVERLAEGGWTLWVAIADVSHYVLPGSAIDLEASVRGNSVYFPQRVIPMLPEALSDNLCSLQPDCDRLAVVARLTLSEVGQIQQQTFLRAVIHSHARLTYKRVASMAEDHQRIPTILQTPLEAAFALHAILSKNKIKRGAIQFDLTDSQVIFDSRGHIERIEPIQRLMSHEMIENFMLCANHAVANALSEAKVPSLFRVHPLPEKEKLQLLQQALSALGVPLKCRLGQVQATTFNQLLQSVRHREDFERIQVLLLKSLSQATYKPENSGHFGLSYDSYTHFTSPIRRYPDLLVHRAVCKHLIEGVAVKQAHSANLQTLAQHCSMTERRADLATRDVLDQLKCHFMLDKIGQQFDGKIVSVTSFGVFIRLSHIYVEGLVHITELPDDYYQFDEAGCQLVGQRTGRQFCIGQSMCIEVVQVNLERGHIDFRPVPI